MKKICGTLLALTLTATAYAELADFSGKSTFVNDTKPGQKCEVRVWPVGKGEYGMSINKTDESGKRESEIIYGELNTAGSLATISSVSADMNYPDVKLRKTAYFSLDTTKQGFTRFKASLTVVAKNIHDLEPYESKTIECNQLRQEVLYGRHQARPLKD